MVQLHVCVCESKEGFVDVFRQLDSVLHYTQNLIAFPSHNVVHLFIQLAIKC